MSNVTIQKRGNFYQYKFETENFYISSTDETRKNVSDVFDSLVNSKTINDIIKYEIAY